MLEELNQAAAQHPQELALTQALLFEIKGDIFYKTDEHRKAAAAFEQALHIYQRPEFTANDSLLPRLADVCYGLGKGLHPLIDTDNNEAVGHLQRALEIRKKLAATDPQSNIYLADILQELGEAHVNNLEESPLSFFRKALDIYKKELSNHPFEILPPMARVLDNQAKFSAKSGMEYQISSQALLIRKMLVQINPDQFLPDLAQATFDSACSINMMGKPEKRLALVEESIAAYRKLEEKYPGKYERESTFLYSLKAQTYRELDKEAEAKKYYHIFMDKQASIIQQGQNANDERGYENDLESLYYGIRDLLDIYQKEKNWEQAEQVLLRVEEILQQAEPIELIMSELVQNYELQADLYETSEQPEKAKALCLKAISLCRRLAGDNTESMFAKGLADFCVRLSALYNKEEQYRQALEFVEVSVEIYTRFAQEDEDYQNDLDEAKQFRSELLENIKASS